jgi:hypothetical protein
MASNKYERDRKVEKVGKAETAARVRLRSTKQRIAILTQVQIIVVVISILLYTRNHGTNAFQLVMGVFFSSNGVGTRPLEALHRMGLSVSASYVGSCSIIHILMSVL